MENLLDEVNYVVMKVGSKAITTDDSLNCSAIENLARVSYDLKSSRKKVVIVTSGAIAAGRRAIGDMHSNGMAEKQMLAAVGQPILMQKYIEIFARYKMHVGQFLLSKMDFDDPGAFSRLRASFQTTLQRGIVPIINENDPVATHEIKFGDNDELQSLIVSRLGGDLAINLINYHGLLRNGKVVDIADSYNAKDYDNLSKEVKEGRGGLQGKLDSMRRVTSSGKYGIIGYVKHDIFGMVTNDVVHTRFCPD